MSQNSPELEEILSRMPAIAAAVNAFQSPETQAIALHALLATMSGEHSKDEESSNAPPPAPESKTSRRRATKLEAKASSTPSAKRGRGGNRSSIDKGVQLRPAGKQAFASFASEKAPSSNHQKGVVAVYYLREIAGYDDVNVEMVNACFKAAAWRLPANSNNNLQVAASKEGWLDTSNMDALKVTSLGSNLIEHDLPKAKPRSS